MDLENSLIVVASFSNSSHLTDSKLRCIRTFDSKCEQRDSESSSRNFSLSISSSRSSSCERINEFIRSLAGPYHLKPATTPNSCHGVFTGRSIFSLNLSRIQIPTGTSVTNCNHKHGLMLTCRHDVDMFTWGRIVLSLPKRAHVDWNWPISREKYLKMVCKNAVALAYYGSCSLLVMGSCSLVYGRVPTKSLPSGLAV